MTGRGKAQTEFKSWAHLRYDRRRKQEGTPTTGIYTQGNAGRGREGEEVVMVRAKLS